MEKEIKDYLSFRDGDIYKIIEKIKSLSFTNKISRQEEEQLILMLPLKSDLEDSDNLNYKEEEEDDDFFYHKDEDVNNNEIFTDNTLDEEYLYKIESINRFADDEEEELPIKNDIEDSSLSFDDEEDTDDFGYKEDEDIKYSNISGLDDNSFNDDEDVKDDGFSYDKDEDIEYSNIEGLDDNSFKDIEEDVSSDGFEYDGNEDFSCYND